MMSHNIGWPSLTPDRILAFRKPLRRHWTIARSDEMQLERQVRSDERTGWSLAERDPAWQAMAEEQVVLAARHSRPYRMRLNIAWSGRLPARHEHPLDWGHSWHLTPVAGSGRHVLRLWFWLSRGQICTL